MAKLPSAQDVTRRTPAFGRSIASIDLSAGARAIGQVGQEVERTAIILEREQEQEQQELARVQQASATAALEIGLNKQMMELQNDQDYATHMPRFQEAANKSLESALKNIQDPNARKIFEERARAAISSKALSVNNKAAAIRQNYMQADALNKSEEFINTLPLVEDENARQEMWRTLSNDIVTKVQTGNMSVAQGRTLKSKIDESFQVASLPSEPKEQLRALKTGKINLKNSTGNVTSDLIIDEELELAGLESKWSNFFKTVAFYESGGNPSAESIASSGKYAGLFQYGENEAKQYGITNRKDPRQNVRGMIERVEDLSSQLQDAGIEPTFGNLYLAHQQGAGGAIALLSNPDMPAHEALNTLGYYKNSNLDPKKAVTQNGGTLNMTAREFSNKWLSKFGETEIDTSAISPATRESLIKDAQNTLRIGLKKDLSSIEAAQKLGVKIDNDFLQSTASTAYALEEVETGDTVSRYIKIQDQVNNFAKKPIAEMIEEYESLKPSVARGEQADIALAYNQVIESKQKALSSDPWSYYVAHDIVEQPVPLDFSNPDSLQEAIDNRRMSVEEVAEMENGAVTLPLISKNEIDQLKEIYNNSTSEEAGKLIANFSSVLSMPERRRASQLIASANDPKLAAIMAMDDMNVAAKIIDGDKTKGAVKAVDLRNSMYDELSGFIDDPEQLESLFDAVYAYYKSEELATGELSESVNVDILDKAITSVIGTPEQINTGGQEPSNVFLYNDETGVEVSANRLEDILTGIDNQILKDINFGELPRTSDGSFVEAEDILNEASFRNAGDGLYVAFYPGLGDILGSDNMPLTFNANYIEKLLNKKGVETSGVRGYEPTGLSGMLR